MYARLPVPKAIFLLPSKGMCRANIKHAEFAYYAFCVNILSIRRRVRTTKTVAFFAESRITAPLCAKKLKIRPHRPDETALRRLRAFCISGYNKHYTRFCIQMMTLHLKINESAATIIKNHCAGDGRALTKGRFVKFTSNEISDREKTSAALKPTRKGAAGNSHSEVNRSRKDACRIKTNEKRRRGKA